MGAQQEGQKVRDGVSASLSRLPGGRPHPRPDSVALIDAWRPTLRRSLLRLSRGHRAQKQGLRVAPRQASVPTLRNSTSGGQCQA